MRCQGCRADRSTLKPSNWCQSMSRVAVCKGVKVLSSAIFGCSGCQDADVVLKGEYITYTWCTSVPSGTCDRQEDNQSIQWWGRSWGNGEGAKDLLPAENRAAIRTYLQFSHYNLQILIGFCQAVSYKAVRNGKGRCPSKEYS